MVYFAKKRPCKCFVGLSFKFVFNMPNKKTLECPVITCEEIFVSYRSLRCHVIEYHGLELKEDKYLLFDNEIDELTKGIPVTGIQNDVCENSTKPTTVRRLDLIGKGDILNIKRDCNINSESTSLCLFSSQSIIRTNSNGDDDIQSMIRAMLKLTKNSVLDSNKEELMVSILAQGMDILFEGISNNDL